MADSNSSQPCKGLSWIYDAWGNRTDQSVTGGTCNAAHVGVNTKNQLLSPPYQYDAAGNLTSDGSHSYTYDAENRLVQVDGGSTATYVYDALGRRVEKTTSAGSIGYIYDLAGRVSTEWCGPCGSYTGWGAGYMYVNGQMLAQYKYGTTQFMHKDHVGSTRLVSNLNQSIADNLDYLPYGEQISGASVTTHEFTGDERDAETGLDHTWFRQYSSQLGRWITPDPFAGYIDNPQSLNRYSYVLNNPLALVDPFGLDCVFLNDSGDGVDEIAPELDAGACGDQGGVYFAGTVDPNSLQFDPNSDFVFAVGTAGNSQFSCGGANCDPNSLADFGNSIFGQSSATVNANAGLVSCFGGDAMCNEQGQPVQVVGNIQSTIPANLAIGAVLFGASDVALVQDGRLFGTRFLGNRPLLNANNYLRVGWSYVRATGEYVFRVGGELVDNGHINLWPPSWWFGPPK